ncbi:DUF535 family protein [Selenomonas sp.]|uniref:DUF535 family protein n=1 Tax=Selenomonas sp. TaxID=2053611 RepID=UPI00260038C6|nr:DUF535 family protein [Selenomonas sp.]MCI6283027.1 VirK/YbjX family protein [Selenomonas sp.]
MNIITLGKRIYRLEKWREFHRFLVFLGRSMLHYRAMKELYTWFQAEEGRCALLERNPYPMEQVTRAFFYAGSTFDERKMLIQHHYEILQRCLQEEPFLSCSTFHSKRIWQSEEGEGWYTDLRFEDGQRKEGLLSLVMVTEEVPLYQMIIWLDYDKNGEPSLFIGAMQGPNVPNAKDLVKEITKRSYRYRTKNLILYMTQAVARSLGMAHIYAVTNAGYYAQNHVRRDRKLKTDFGTFWEEAGGHPTDDPRFDELPLTEPRKTMEEVPTRKRAQYRKRFAFLDDVDAQIARNMQAILRDATKPE